MSFSVSPGVFNRERIEYFWPVLGLILCLTGAMEAFPLSFVSKSNVWIGLCLLPLVLRVRDKPRLHYGYLLGVLFLFFVTEWYYSVRTFYFFALMLYLLLIAEAYFGRVDVLVWFLLLFMSPVFQQAAVIMGFPIRLMLSAWAGSLMNLAGFGVTVEGNLMTVHGSSFAVDDACMGLNMLAVSLLAGVFAIAYPARRDGLRLSLPAMLAFFGTVFLINILSNLFRIIILVIFGIGPENNLHGPVGLVCLVVYVLIPLYFLSRWWLSRWGRPWGATVANAPPSTLLSMGLVAVAGLLLLTGVGIGRSRNDAVPVRSDVAAIQWPGFTATPVKDGVTKLEDDEALVYVKPIYEFFTSEHTPLLCWKGSGYEFKTVKEDSVNHAAIYRGVLARGSAKLYTAWWYTDGTTHTICQAQWRWDMFKGGRRYYLINVTTSDEDTLLRKVAQVMIQEHSLK